MDERRGNDRYRVWFPMTVVTDDGEEGTAITYDVSATGVLMACPGRLDVGAHVTLRFRVEADAPETSIAAKLIRVEESPDEQGPWRFRLAVEFDEPHPELEAIVAQHAESGT